MATIIRDLAASVTVGFLAAFLSGCVMEYEVELFNHTAHPVLFTMVQYHSKEFNGTPPRQFSDSLIVGRREIQVAANESSKVVFDSGAGGFWIRWKVIGGSEPQSTWSTLDLVRDERAIHVR